MRLKPVWAWPSLFTACHLLLCIIILSKKLTSSVPQTPIKAGVLFLFTRVPGTCLPDPVLRTLWCVTFNLICVRYEHYQKLKVPFGVDSIDLPLRGHIFLSSILDTFFSLSFLSGRQLGALALNTDGSQISFFFSGLCALALLHESLLSTFEVEIC